LWTEWGLGVYKTNIGKRGVKRRRDVTVVDLVRIGTKVRRRGNRRGPQKDATIQKELVTMSLKRLETVHQKNTQGQRKGSGLADDLRGVGGPGLRVLGRSRQAGEAGSEKKGRWGDEVQSRTNPLTAKLETSGGTWNRPWSDCGRDWRRGSTSPKAQH